MTGGETGRGRLRVSDVDRERAIDILKTAFVQGRLTHEELGARAGEVLASRTYAELNAITADIPGGQIVAPLLPGPVRARARTSGHRRVVVSTTGTIMALTLMGSAFFTYYGGFIVVFLVLVVAMALTAEPVSR